jgi:hypothetical protein
VDFLSTFQVSCQGAEARGTQQNNYGCSAGSGLFCGRRCLRIFGDAAFRASNSSVSSWACKLYRIKSYFGFVTNIIFWIGLSFELPLLIFVLARIGILNAGMLAKGWRVAVVIIAVLAAVITPTADR